MKLALTRLCNGADIKTAKPGDTLRFGNSLYLLVSPTGIKSWQIRYHVGGRSSGDDHRALARSRDRRGEGEARGDQADGARGRRSGP